jgi:flagellar motor switch/type III secretory pathway protein FliN
MSEKAEKPEKPNLHSVAGVQVAVTARLAARSLTLGEILELRPGRTVSFPHHVDEPVFLEVDGVTVGRGHVVERGGELGFLIEET